MDLRTKSNAMQCSVSTMHDNCSLVYKQLSDVSIVLGKIKRFNDVKIGRK